MNRMTFWGRLRAWWGLTLATFGWRRSHGVYFTRVPPEPWWRRLFNIGTSAPPPPQMIRPGPPPWLMPPEAELGVAVPIHEVLASDADTAIGLMDCVAFSTGFEFAIAVRAREDIDPEQMGFGRPDLSGRQWAQRQLQIGIEFADGRKAVEGSQPGPELMDHWKLHQAGGEPGSADGPILAHRSGGGGGRRYDFRFWVWPLPPEGSITFTCVWPARGLGPSEHHVDGTAIRRAGEASRKLWNGP